MMQRTLCSMSFALVLALMGCDGTTPPGSTPEQVDALSTVQPSDDGKAEPGNQPATDSGGITADNDATIDLDTDDASDTDDADGEVSGPLLLVVGEERHLGPYRW